jgi:predicted MFS family arabinose efflux permease
LGAAGLAAGLSAALLTITQGNSWGWSSPATLGSAAFAVTVLVAWWVWEKRLDYPLLSTEMLTRRPVLLTNLATIFVGMGLYFGFLGLTQFVQVDRAVAGYGFSAMVLDASLVYLLPGALTGFVTATLSGRFIDRFGARPVLVCGALTGVVGFLWLALAHSAPWQVIVAGIWTNAYISLAYGALPALVVSEVDGGETGVATGVNAIARTVGSAIAAAVVAVLLGRTVAGMGLPPEHGFVTIFIAGAVTAGLAMVLIAVSRSGRRNVVTVEATVDSRAMNHEWG